ncbi:hypothetical protein [Actinacidiphila yeochonensis]|uniref:hypothetical protein n=1 Tax=Actinacidiphila yeochonensis TaxID=89050 RepID=UPI000A7D0209|nr:hypothetical protein [Actinacidiphila yeochonensis]
MPGDGHWQRTRRAGNGSRLRAFVIERLGPDRGDPDWDPDLLAADILAALTLTPARTRDLSGRLRALPTDRLGALRRARNATAPLQRLFRHLRPDPTRDQARERLAVRDLLP